MSETLRDLCAEAINVDGTGDAVFYGALRGHRTFSEAYDGVLPLSGVRIKIEEADEEGRIVRWEDSECTVTETGFSRDTCVHSSNSNDFVEFGPGYKRAFVFIPVDAIGSGGGGGEVFSFVVTSGAPIGAGGALPGWYCFDSLNGDLYGPLPDYAAPEVPEWPLVGQVGVGSGDSRLSDARTPTAHTHPLSALTQSGATTGQVPTWSGSAWAPATPSSGGGMAIGGAITGAANNRILQSDGSGNLAQQGTWYFDSLGFGAIMPTQQALRTTDGGGGFIGNIGGGILMGRTDVYPDVFIGFYSNGGITVHPNSGYNFGSNVNDLRINDGRLTRRAADLIEGACLAKRAYTVATLPNAATWINAEVICTNESGGRVPVFSDGTNWRRVTDRAIAS